MLFEFLKIDSQFLEIDFQISSPIFLETSFYKLLLEISFYKNVEDVRCDT
jgi:hypothetical protein